PNNPFYSNGSSIYENDNATDCNRYIFNERNGTGRKYFINNEISLNGSEFIAFNISGDIAMNAMMLYDNDNSPPNLHLIPIHNSTINKELGGEPYGLISRCFKKSSDKIESLESLDEDFKSLENFFKR
ncbi:14080_t:CDS:2, partial [Gigaspora rosea]